MQKVDKVDVSSRKDNTEKINEIVDKVNEIIDKINKIENQQS